MGDNWGPTVVIIISLCMINIIIIKIRISHAFTALLRLCLFRHDMSKTGVLLVEYIICSTNSSHIHKRAATYIYDPNIYIEDIMIYYLLYSALHIELREARHKLITHHSQLSSFIFTCLLRSIHPWETNNVVIERKRLIR